MGADEGKTAAQEPASAWPALAEQGDALAQALLARAALYGTDGQVHDRDKALKWAAAAAAQNHPLGHFMLGMAASYGSGNPTDEAKAKAREHFEEAISEGLLRDAARGGRQWMALVGDAYFGGYGVENDDRQASRWHRRAAALGDGNAIASMAVLYRSGLGVAKNEEKAAEWFHKAAEAGDSAGCLGYGECLRYGCGVERDMKAAGKWFRRGVDLNSPVGMVLLGDWILEEEAARAPEAVRLFEKAAGQSCVPAMVQLGICYSDGLGVKADPEVAAEWFHKAAAINGVDGLFTMGRVYEGGSLFPRDIRQATLWYRAADAMGHEEAAEALRRLNAKQQ
ncbi:MAG: sel1 repeat family protein [Akkermansiaceae bacterium]|nr:sel1 repeat family protein [Akkermansiaceae bacterium]